MHSGEVRVRAALNVHRSLVGAVTLIDFLKVRGINWGENSAESHSAF